MTRESWNFEILGEAGMIFTGLQNLIEQGALPYKLDSVVWNNKGILYGFRIDDTFFDYFFGITDERPLINRIAGTMDEYTERMLTLTEEIQKECQKMIHINLRSIGFTLLFDSEKNVLFDGLGHTFGGFFDDVEFYSSSNKKKITFDIFANHINSSEPTEEKISEPTEEKNVGSSDESTDSQWEESSIFELLMKREYFAAIKRYSQMYKVDIGEAGVRMANYLIKHPDRFPNDSRHRLSEEPEINEPIVRIHSFVKYRNCETNEVFTDQLVPSDEFEIGKRVFTLKSPFGKAFLGKPKGAVLKVVGNFGEITDYEILDVL